MSAFWQTVISAVIPAALALLVAYRGAISRTSRLISAIRVNVELLSAGPEVLSVTSVDAARRVVL
jgi:hypothetical protein